jgi:hypothetical protein
MPCTTTTATRTTSSGNSTPRASIPPCRHPRPRNRTCSHVRPAPPRFDGGRQPCTNRTCTWRPTGVERAGTHPGPGADRRASRIVAGGRGQHVLRGGGLAGGGTNGGRNQENLAVQAATSDSVVVLGHRASRSWAGRAGRPQHVWRFTRTAEQVVVGREIGDRPVATRWPQGATPVAAS